MLKKKTPSKIRPIPTTLSSFKAILSKQTTAKPASATVKANIFVLLNLGSARIFCASSPDNRGDKPNINDIKPEDKYCAER